MPNFTSTETIPVVLVYMTPVEYQAIFSGGRGGSTNSVEDRKNGDLGAIAP